MRRRIDKPRQEVETHAAAGDTTTVSVPLSGSGAAISLISPTSIDAFTTATPRAMPLELRIASMAAVLSVPWQLACTMTLR